jgi:hypothetical protein
MTSNLKMESEIAGFISGIKPALLISERCIIHELQKFPYVMASYGKIYIQDESDSDMIKESLKNRFSIGLILGYPPSAVKWFENIFYVNDKDIDKNYRIFIDVGFLHFTTNVYLVNENIEWVRKTYGNDNMAYIKITFYVDRIKNGLVFTKDTKNIQNAIIEYIKSKI